METNTKLLLIIVFLGIVVILAIFTSAIFPIISIFLVAAFFAYILSPAVSALEGKGFPRWLGTTLIFVLFFGAIVVGLYVIAPLIADQMGAIQEKISIGTMKRAIKDIDTFVNKNFGFLGLKKWHIAPQIESGVNKLVENVIGIASGVVGLMIYGVMTLFTTFFLMKDGPSLRKGLISIAPNRFFEMSLSIVDKIDWSLGAYLRGILLDAFIIGNVTMLAMWIIGVPYFTVIGLFAGICNVVPYLGPPTGALVASIVSVISTGNFDGVPLILFVFAMIRLLDDVVVQPLTISRSVQMHPITVIFALLVGAELYGIIGMLFAVPVAGVLKVFLSEFYFGLQRYRSL